MVAFPAGLKEIRVVFHPRFRARIVTAWKKLNGVVAAAQKPTTVPKCVRNITGCTATTASATVMINFNLFTSLHFSCISFFLSNTQINIWILSRQEKLWNESSLLWLQLFLKISFSRYSSSIKVLKFISVLLCAFIDPEIKRNNKSQLFLYSTFQNRIFPKKSCKK